MERKIVSRIMLALLFISTLALAFNTTPVRARIKISDDFNDNSINSDLWSEVQYGGPTVNEINQRLEIFFPWDSAGEVFGAGYYSKRLLRGDFDIQVDFSLLDWPSVDQLGTGNGVRIGLAVGEGENWWSVGRTSFGSLTADFPGYPREVYLSGFAGSVKGITPTDDMSGKLRLVRSGSTLTGYYFSSGSWVTVASGWVTTGDVSFSPNAWSHDYAFMDNSVLLAFDNFIVNRGRIARAWPPEEEWLPLSPDEVWPEMRKIRVYGGHHDLYPGEPFFLCYGWIFLPTNVVYDAEDGHVVEPFECLQNRDSNAQPHYSITLGGQPLLPNMLKCTVNWWRFYNDPELYPNPPVEFPLGDWAIAPKGMAYEYWVEFPDGLEQGDYEVILAGYPAGHKGLTDSWQPFEFHTYLHVWPES